AELMRRAVAWAAETEGAGGRVIDDVSVRERLARAAVDFEGGSLLTGRSLLRTAHGVPRGPGRGQGAQLYETHALAPGPAALLAMVGPEGVIPFEEEGTVAGGWFNYCFRDAPVHLLGGGVSEVMREVIAERRLGLPRNRPTAPADQGS